MNKVILECRHVAHHFIQGGKKLPILKNINLTLNKGQMVALVGPSGSGKSTLLHLTGLLEKPCEGEIIFSNQLCTHLSDDQKTSIRRQDMGFVYQYHHLLPEFTALENATLPLLIQGSLQKEAISMANSLLDELGLSHRTAHYPSQLSGGEQQRVAIARALVAQPSLLLADEPTGNLDPSTSTHVFNLLQKLVKTLNVATLFATHNMALAKQADRCFILKDGEIAEN